MRVGILGGTFDPPHIGHLVLADSAIQSLRLDTLLFVPAADPPHKTGTRAPIEHRLPMLERAVSLDRRFAISRVDIDRPGPHYTADMVAIIQAEHPGADLFFLMGSDSLRDLPGWHEPERLIAQVKLGVMQRPGAEARPEMHAARWPGLPERVIPIDAPRLDVSSTEIVERLSAGKTVRFLVPEAVLEYIARHEVYRD